MVSKEEFAAALRSHQVAIDATKSPQRAERGSSKIEEGQHLESKSLILLTL